VTQRHTGYRRPKDGGDRSRPFAAHRLGGGVVPERADLTPLTMVVDQGQHSSCVGNSTANVLRGAQLAAGAPASTPLPSRWAIYWLARAYVSEQDIDAGAFIHLAFQGLNTFGFGPEDLWPYSTDDDRWKRMPPLSLIEAAFPQSLAGGARPQVDYQRILSVGGQRVDDVKRALGAGHLVVFGTDVSEAFCGGQLGPSGIAYPPSSSDPIAGGHAMVWCGHRPEAVRTLTSWGPGVFEGGYFDMDWSYVEDERTDDIWVVAKAPRYVGY